MTNRVPERGHAVWIEKDPQAGHEQRGRRPALVMSPASYNGKVGLVLICPITSRIKGYPFEVVIPEGLKVSGAVLADQVKSLDWRARKARLICVLPADTVAATLSRLSPLLDPVVSTRSRVLRDRRA